MVGRFKQNKLYRGNIDSKKQNVDILKRLFKKRKKEVE